MKGLHFSYDYVVAGEAKPFYERFFHIATSAYFHDRAMNSALSVVWYPPISKHCDGLSGCKVECEKPFIFTNSNIILHHNLSSLSFDWNLKEIDPPKSATLTLLKIISRCSIQTQYPVNTLA